jgi:hypothetical protein
MQAGMVVGKCTTTKTLRRTPKMQSQILSLFLIAAHQAINILLSNAM